MTAPVCFRNASYDGSRGLRVNYRDIYLLVKKSGEVERIRMKLTVDEAFFNCFIIFKCSNSASHANNFLNGHSVNDCTLKTKLFSVDNLQEDPHDYIPEQIYNSEKKPLRSCPRPMWFVASYKAGRENYAKGIEAIQMQAGSIPEGNVKRYGKAILIKARNFSQAKMLMNFKNQNTNIDSVTPHKTFNTVKGVMYSKDIYEYTEEEILERCPSSVFQVRKLKGINSAILLTFSTEYIPDYIRFGTHIKISVKRYKPKPTQCFNCLDYGHVITRCSNPKRCEKCSSQHQEWSECDLPLYCFLCQGSHSPTSKECNRKKFEQEVAEVALYQHLSISNARRQVLGANRDPSFSYASVIKQTKLVTVKNHLAAVPSKAQIQKSKDSFSSADSRQSTSQEGRIYVDKDKSIDNNSAPSSYLDSVIIQKDKSAAGAINKERKNLEQTSSKKPKSRTSSEEASEPPVKKRALNLSPKTSQELKLSNSYSVLEEMEDEMATDSQFAIVSSLPNIMGNKENTQNQEKSDSVPTPREITNQTSSHVESCPTKTNNQTHPPITCQNTNNLDKRTLKHADRDQSVDIKLNSSSNKDSKIPVAQAQSRHSSLLKRLNKNSNPAHAQNKNSIPAQTQNKNSNPAHTSNAISGRVEKKSK